MHGHDSLMRVTVRMILKKFSLNFLNTVEVNIAKFLLGLFYAILL